MNTAQQTRITIVGGGTAGIATAARLRRKLPHAQICIIEPKQKHYYQPGWTLVGGGIIKKEATERNMSDVMPPNVQWLQDTVREFQPENNKVLLGSGKPHDYDYLIVAAGIQIDWGKIPGLKESLGKAGVCSIYDYACSEKTWDLISSFQGGNAIFTQPKPPFKCPGAAQKIMYLADDNFRQRHIRDKTQIFFRSAAPGIFPVKKYAETLNQVLARKDIKLKFQHHLIEIRPELHEAVFENIVDNSQEILKYDLLHVTPPMSAPDFIKNSPLADAAGWVDVNKHTLQHSRYPNIYGLGDVTNTPNSKTAAAIRNQMPVLTQHLSAAINNRTSDAKYNGYASCPLITGYGKLVLAEFDYDLQPQETFPFNQAKERLSMYWLKRYVLPSFYWHGLLKGYTLGE